jgi:hypothetical protein
MKLHTRRRIFYVFLLLFVVIGLLVVLYAEGWRLNPITLDAEKAGGIYVRSYPDDATIKLDGKVIENQSAFLSRGTFISGLFPKTYTVTLSDPGYDAWSEQAQVVPSLVSEMKYAVLVPNMAMNVATSEDVNNFFEIDRNLVTQNTSGMIMLNGTNTPIGGGGGAISNGTIVSHSTNLKTAVIRSLNIKNGAAIYWLYDFTNVTSTNLDPLLQQQGIKITPQLNIFIDPYDDTNVIVQTGGTIISIDSETKRASVIEDAPMGKTIGTPLAISPSVMAWTLYASSTNTSQVMVYDKFSGDITDNSLTVAGGIKQLAWVKNNELGVLEDNNTLYLYNVSNEQLTSLANDVKQFYPTADGAAIAALEYHSLEVFFFNTTDYYRFSLPQAENVQGLIWYKDENHLFVDYADHVSFLDFTDTNLKNFTTVSDGTAPWYDPQQNSLYLIDQGQRLLRFDFPQ